MAAVNHPGEGAELYEAVYAIGVRNFPSRLALKRSVLGALRHVSTP